MTRKVINGDNNSNGRNVSFGCSKYEFDSFDPLTTTVKWMTKQKKDNDKKTNN